LFLVGRKGVGRNGGPYQGLNIILIESPDTQSNKPVKAREFINVKTSALKMEAEYSSERSVSIRLQEYTVS
jgi:hypothetical protein